MMRPTASSANKSHPQEKTDAKLVTKAATVSKAPRPSIGRVPDRGVHQVKPKSTALRPQSQKSQPLNKEPAPQKDGHKPSQKKQESEKENVVGPTSVEPTSFAAVEPPEAASKPVEETASPAQVEASTPGVAIASAEPTEKAIEVPEPIIEETVTESSSNPVPVEDATEVLAEPTDSNEAQAKVDTPVDSLIEPIAEDAEEEKAAETTATEETVAEPVVIATADDQVKIDEKQEISIPEPEVLETPQSTEAQDVASEKEDDVPVKEVIVSETLAEENLTEAKSIEEPTPDAQPATEAESSNVAIDIASLALN